MIVCVDGDDLPMAGRAGERQPKELVSRPSVDRVQSQVAFRGVAGDRRRNYSALLLCWASEVVWFGDADV
jgi:hypothetical protein